MFCLVTGRHTDFSSLGHKDVQLIANKESSVLFLVTIIYILWLYFFTLFHKSGHFVTYAGCYFKITWHENYHFGTALLNCDKKFPNNGPKHK